ncbi:hypothetical protein CRENBAI_013115 [Crenichthys baileyi]|uniref:Uncharacterized protein n=1 Tax=Crenichthys baileyi TaxID=28760 RepID=A0AAV9QWF8_9TELE
MERIRQMERDYETAVKAGVLLPSPLPPPGLQGAVCVAFPAAAFKSEPPPKGARGLLKAPPTPRTPGGLGFCCRAAHAPDSRECCCFARSSPRPGFQGGLLACPKQPTPAPLSPGFFGKPPPKPAFSARGRAHFQHPISAPGLTLHSPNSTPPKPPKPVSRVWGSDPPQPVSAGSDTSPTPGSLPPGVWHSQQPVSCRDDTPKACPFPRGLTLHGPVFPPRAAAHSTACLLPGSDNSTACLWGPDTPQPGHSTAKTSPQPDTPQPDTKPTPEHTTA